MNDLEPFARVWLTWMTAASWQLAILVCIIALLAALASALRAPAQLRHGLWLLVLIKVFLPPALSTPLSLGYWTTGPILAQLSLDQSWLTPSSLSRDDPSISSTDAPTLPTTSPASSSLRSLLFNSLSVPLLLLFTWSAGVLLFWFVVAWRYRALAQVLRAARPLDEGPLRIALEEIALDLGLSRVPELVASLSVSTPFLCGIFRPRIVLPASLLSQAESSQLRAVLTHELVHCQRCDTLVGWLQVIAQSLFWFHPLVWWANSQLRHQRECACDETVLSLGCVTPEHYSESLLHILLKTRGPSLVAGSLVGVFERGANLHNRLENIMNHRPLHRNFSGLSRLALAALAIVLLPMAPRPETTALAAPPTEPQIVATTPKLGATDVDPGLKEISVKFDRDMSTGASWTGGPPLFPPIAEGQKLRWTDARTCVLPVKLEKATFYRLGINSSTHRNFKSKDGTPAPAAALYFVTKGASDEVKNRCIAPAIVKLEPANGAQDADPALTALKVTFNMQMGEGMSWTGGGPQFPKLPTDTKAAWSADGRTCTLPVALEPGRDYELGLNSPQHINFQSQWGVPLIPISYTFKTRP